MVNKNDKSSGNQTVSTNSAREAEQIKRENNNIYGNLRELEKQEQHIYGQKKEMILQLASNYERLAEIGEYKMPINNICATISSELRQRNMFATDRYCREVLPSKFKQEEFDSTPDDSTSNSFSVSGGGFSSTGHVGSDNSGMFFSNNSSADVMKPTYYEPNQYVPINPLKMIKQETSLDKMTNDELRNHTEHIWKINKPLKEQTRELSRRAEAALEECRKRKVAIDEEIVKINDEEKFTTKVGESGESQLYHALKYYAKVIDKAADKVYKFKPKDKDARIWAKAILVMAELWKPWADEKYRKDSISWMLVQMDNLAHGKHAAATMHSSITPDGVKRALTREQVGDKYEAVLQQAVKFTTAFSDMIAMHRWHLDLTERGIADRAVRMHSKLSEKS